MKKFSWILILLFGALLFTACASDDEEDAGDTTAGDTAYGDTASDTGTGDTTSDTGDTASDTGDTTGDTGSADTGAADTGAADTGSADTGTGDTGEGEYCGDGIKNGSEKCDNGEANGATDCAYGEKSCLICTKGCTEAAGKASYCGDGIVDEEHEGCDEGEELNGTYGHCNADCSGEGEYCGDGIKNGSEKCDNGTNNGTYGHCKADCSGMGEYCGDGIKNGSEVCDEGEFNGKYGYCKSDCSEMGAHCGDGKLDAGFETCDEGGLNGSGYGKCNETCERIIACGDGFKDGPETCDDGAANGTYSVIKTCNSDCAGYGDGGYCGDGIVDAGNGEICDEGELNGTFGHCTMACTGYIVCGDGIVTYPEICDDGELNGTYGHCASDCLALASHCGDGVIDAEDGEECEPGLPVEGNCTDYSEENCSSSQLLNVTTSTTGTWTVPETGFYKITIAGGQGGSGGKNSSGNIVAGGKGAFLTTVYQLTKGQTFYYSVGAQGTSKNSVGGGGGASYIGAGSSYSAAASTSTILLIAGGGGGAADTVSGGNGSSPTTSFEKTGAGTGKYGGNGGGLIGSADGIGGKALSIGGAAGTGGNGGNGGNGGGGAGQYEINENVKYGCDTSLCLLGCSKKDFVSYNGGGGGGLVGGNGGNSHYLLPDDCDEYGGSSLTRSAGQAGTSYRREDSAIEGVVYIKGDYTYSSSNTQTGNGKIVIERVCASFQSGPLYCNAHTCRKTVYGDYSNQCTPEEPLLNKPMCGNNIVDAGEVCEVSSYSSKSCSELAGAGEVYPTSVYAYCNSDCTAYDTDPCLNTCGNGTLDKFSDGTAEECEAGIKMPIDPSLTSFDSSSSKEFSNLRADSAWNIYAAPYPTYDLVPGLLKSLVLTANAASSRPRNMKIYLKSTESGSLAEQTWAELKTNAVLVYDHDLDGIANGANEFVFDKKYVHPAGKALVLIVVQQYDTTLGAPAETLANATTYNYAGYLFLRSNSSDEPLGSTMTKSSSSNKPVMILNYEFATASDKMTCEDYGFTGGEIKCSGCALITETCTRE